MDQPTFPPVQEPRILPDMVDRALFYARKGIRVLPLHSIDETGMCTCGHAQCSSIGKHPLTANGVKNATRDAGDIRAWWRTWPFANIGLATGQGLVVIDIDPRHGGTLEAFADLVDLSQVSMVETGSGGWHLYFRYEDGMSLRNTAGKLGNGIDTRANEGYVVAPPSLHASGRRYRWIGKGQITLVPPALLDLLIKSGSGSQKRPRTEIPAAPPAPEVISQPEAPIDVQKVIPEGKRNTSLVSLAGTLRQWGADDKVLFPMLQVMNKTCCQPVLLDEEVKQIARSAAQWEQGAIRAKGIVDVSAKAIMTEATPEMAWAIAGLLPEGITLLGGKPKKGKTYLALGIALAVAHGTSVLGYPASAPGRTLFMGLEEPRRGMRDRLRTMLGDTPPPNLFTWCGESRPLLAGGMEDLEAWFSRNQDARLIVIDTLERVRTDNTSSSIYSYDYKTITPLKQFGDRHHLSILVVHHLRKGSSDDPMEEFSGSLGLTGSTDCNMVLHRLHKSDEGTLHILGNYVDDQEVSLHFHKERMTWEKAGKEPKTVSPERQAILDLLRLEGCPMAPVEIARKVGRDRSTVRTMLASMKRDEQLVVVGQGMYMLAASAQQQALLEEEAN